MTWFDSTGIEPTQGGAQLPVGSHRVAITDSVRTQVKGKNDSYLALTLQIIDGPFAGASGVTRLNLWNSDTQASEIAGRTLSAYCHVTRTYQLINQTKLGMEMFGKPFRVVVQPQPDPKYTEVTTILDDSGAPPTRQQQPAQPQAPAPGAPGNFQSPAQQPALPGSYAAPGPNGGQPQFTPQPPQPQQPIVYPSPQPQGTVQPQQPAYQQPPQPQANPAASQQPQPAWAAQPPQQPGNSGAPPWTQGR